MALFDLNDEIKFEAQLVIGPPGTYTFVTAHPPPQDRELLASWGSTIRDLKGTTTTAVCIPPGYLAQNGGNFLYTVLGDRWRAAFSEEIPDSEIIVHAMQGYMNMGPPQEIYNAPDRIAAWVETTVPWENANDKRLIGNVIQQIASWVLTKLRDAFVCDVITQCLEEDDVGWPLVIANRAFTRLSVLSQEDFAHSLDYTLRRMPEYARAPFFAMMLQHYKKPPKIIQFRAELFQGCSQRYATQKMRTHKLHMKVWSSIYEVIELWLLDFREERTPGAAGKVVTLNQKHISRCRKYGDDATHFSADMLLGKIRDEYPAMATEMDRRRVIFVTQQFWKPYLILRVQVANPPVFFATVRNRKQLAVELLLPDDPQEAPAPQKKRKVQVVRDVSEFET